MIVTEIPVFMSKLPLMNMVLHNRNIAARAGNKGNLSSKIHE